MNGIAYADLILRVIELLAPALIRESAEFSRMRAMVAEEREPTDAEWDELFASFESNRARLHAAALERTRLEDL